MLNAALSSKLHDICGRLGTMPTKDEGSTALGLRIHDRRRKSGLTQEQLADKAGCTKGAVSQWETGDVRNLRLPHLFRVADILKVEPRWLALGVGPEEIVRDVPHGVPPDKVVRLAKKLAELPDDEQKLLLKIFERTTPPR